MLHLRGEDVVPMKLLGFGLTAIVAVACMGCGKSLPPAPKPAALVEAGGTVTMDGKPLEGAMVLFNPKSDGGFAAYAITDSAGKYKAETRVGAEVKPGLSPASYQVMVSRLLKPDGTPPMDPMEPPAHSGARESLPSKYSSPAESKLRAVVGASGGQFDFDLKK